MFTVKGNKYKVVSYYYLISKSPVYWTYCYTHCNAWSSKGLETGCKVLKQNGITEKWWCWINSVSVFIHPGNRGNGAL